AYRRSSTYGPFFSERLMVQRPFKRRNYCRSAPSPRPPVLPPPPRGREQKGLLRRVVRAGAAAADDGRVGRLPLLAGLAALGQHARRAARVAAAGGAPLAAAHRVADRVHRGAAVVRLAAHPALAAGLAQADVHVVGVADGADRRPARRADASHLARRQRDLRPLPLAGGQGRAGPRRTAHLAAAAGLHLDVVDRHAQGDPGQRHAVADLGLAVLAADDLLPGLHPLGGQDVGPLAVLVLDQGDPGGPVGVVLDGDDGGPDAILAALEVDDAVQPLVAAAAEARADDALVVAAALLGVRLDQRLFRPLLAVGQVAEVADRALTPARRRRFVFADSHILLVFGVWCFVFRPNTKHQTPNTLH